MRTEQYTSSNWSAVDRNRVEHQQRSFSKVAITSMSFDETVDTVQNYIDMTWYESARTIVEWSDYPKERIVDELIYDENEIDFK